MKKKLRNIFFTFTLGFCLVSCASNTRNENAGYCAAAGVALGLATGNPIIVVGGAILGLGVGHNLPASDEPL